MDGLGVGWRPERVTVETYLHRASGALSGLGAQSSLRSSSAAYSRRDSWGIIVALMCLICFPPM